MLHDEREISLSEIANALKSIYQTIDKLDSKLISLEPGKRESIFINNSVLYNRKAVSFAYDLLSEYIKYEKSRDIKLCLYSKPLQDLIDIHESFDTVVDKFCKGGEDLDYSNKFYIETSFFGELCAYLLHLVETALSMCLKYEIDILTNFSTDRRGKELKKRIKELERNKYFFSKEHSIQLNSYAYQKLKKLKYIQEDLEEEQEGLANNPLTEARKFESDNIGNQKSKMDRIKLEILTIIEKNGTLLIHKDLPETYFPVLNKMEAYGLIKKEKGSYKMLIEGYEELDLLKSKTSDESVEVVKYDLDFKLLKEMIGRNELEEAIKHMLSQTVASSTVSNQLIVNLSRFKKLKDSIIEGTISFEEQNLEKNRITISVLEIINNLEAKI